MEVDYDSGQFVPLLLNGIGFGLAASLHISLSPLLVDLHKLDEQAVNFLHLFKTLFWVTLVSNVCQLGQQALEVCGIGQAWVCLFGKVQNLLGLLKVDVKLLIGQKLGGGCG